MRPHLWWLGAVLGTSLIAADVLGRVRQGTADLEFAVVMAAAGLVFAAACALWAQRPESRVGRLLLIWPAAAIVDDLPSAYPYSSTVLTASLVASALATGAFAHVTLAYPSGRLGSRGLRAFVAAVYGV